MVRLIIDLPEAYTVDMVYRVLTEYDRLQGEWIEAERTHDWPRKQEVTEKSERLADDFLGDCMSSWRIEDDECEVEG